MAQWEASINSCGYTNKTKVVNEVREVLFQTKSLRPNVESYVFNDGKMANLLSLSGTIPIHYRRNQYNIPVKMWITKDYPSTPPIGYVTPTKDMRIHKGHPNVNESGTIYMSYPIWHAGSSTLTTLCFTLSENFSKKPPVYRSSSMPIRPIQRAQPVYRPNTGQSQPVQIARPVWQNTPNGQPNGYAQPQQPQLPVRPHPNSHLYADVNPYADTKAQLKEQLLRKARGILSTRTQERLDSQTEEIRKLQAYEFKLKNNQLQLARSKAEMAHEKQLLERTVVELDKQAEHLEKWVKENKEKKIDVDVAIRGRDTWSEQILVEVAKDSAIEDALYALDKALENGKLSLDVFLRHVRRLSKQQFQHRALALKIMQHQQQHAAMQM